MEIEKLLEELANAHGISGNEESIRKIMER
jgi:endoglucanase